MSFRTKVTICSIVLVIGLVAIGIGIYSLGTPAEADNKEPEQTTIQKEVYTYPYTGLKADNKESTEMRPLCVKIPNDPPARPQTGLNSADVVYETMVEGWETRLNCIFQSNVPEDVGPVRSARLSDLWVTPQYNGMLFFSGANNEVKPLIKKNNISDMSWGGSQSIYHRVSGRGNLHNLHIKLKEAYNLAEKKGYETSSSSIKPLHYEGVSYEDESSGSAVEANISTADSKLDAFDDKESGKFLQIKLAPIANVKFEWDDKNEVYLKYMNDLEHMDAAEDKQVNCVNVVVMWAKYTQQDKKDPAGNPTYDTMLGGEGNVAVFKDGNKYEGTWKADKDTPPRFYDTDGKEIRLNPGNTWILVPQEKTKLKTK